MNAQEWIALGVVVVAVAWLVRRWRKSGLDEHEQQGPGCGSCGSSAENGAAGPRKDA